MIHHFGPRQAIVSVAGVPATTIRAENGEIFVVIKPICEALGLDPRGQQKRVQDDERFNCGDMAVVAADGKTRQMGCLPLDQLVGWLYTVNTNKVKPDARAALLAFQRESTKAIHDYWAGTATAPRNAANTVQNGGMTDVMRMMCDTIDEMNARVSATEQAVAEVKAELDNSPIDSLQRGQVHALGQQLGRKIGYARAWRRFNDRFGIARYADLPRCEFAAAMDYLQQQVVLEKARGGLFDA